MPARSLLSDLGSLAIGLLIVAAVILVSLHVGGWLFNDPAYPR